MSAPKGYWENVGDELTVEIVDASTGRYVDVDLMSGHAFARLTAEQAREVAAKLVECAAYIEES